MALIHFSCPSAETARAQNNRETIYVFLEIASKKWSFGAQMSACGSLPTHYPV